ncbi:hypothetical protein PHYSODRAFT_322453 [Phytophthora sojae]|uniref:Uncharacterized protein n=1 Tax=Phytophthora sojae (strain P6497) TaxID=1094619 RepID=G4YKJ4_PHYSP|nr:hypothetical protein PHYSODRAFT_322453 [Phytophthora sojae]EGZ28826.1 hypothetical protein PHYSODRAFT_322453 [Phytophthora sojae]|eukprot:XP_009516101.1 hypothetical protein PHYSODRAFT_322453 [Phytophthora sojae]
MLQRTDFGLLTAFYFGVQGLLEISETTVGFVAHALNLQIEIMDGSMKTCSVATRCFKKILGDVKTAPEIQHLVIEGRGDLSSLDNARAFR